MSIKLKPCPHCNENTLSLGNYSEDGASVTEIHCSSEKCKPNPWHLKTIDSLYQGNDNLRFGRERCEREYNQFKAKWSAV